MKIPNKVERYGKEVWEMSVMDTLRREYCMCLHCNKMRPLLPENCKIAQSFFELCKKHGNAFIMTRCSEWEAIK